MSKEPQDKRPKGLQKPAKDPIDPTNLPDLPPEVVKALEEMPPDKAALMVRIARQGPIPDADLMARYEEVNPIINRVILEEYQRDKEHDRTENSKALSAEINYRVRGQRYALVITVLMIGAGLALAWFVNPWAGVALAGSQPLLKIADRFINRHLGGGADEVPEQSGKNRKKKR